MPAPETPALACATAEHDLRVDLAACCRWVALFGWDDLVFPHISARAPGSQDHFLVNPYGMLSDEVTASSVVKVDARGEKVEPSAYPINPAGFVIHSAVHQARPEVGCVIHVHSTAGVAVSAQKTGLLPISQKATVVLTSLGYHDYEGIVLREDEKTRLAANLGDKTSLIMRSHGLLTVGATVGDAFLAMYQLQRACEIQLLAQSGGAELISIPPEILAGAKANLTAATMGLRGLLSWPGLLRRLDRLDPTFRH